MHLTELNLTSLTQLTEADFLNQTLEPNVINSSNQNQSRLMLVKTNVKYVIIH